MKIKPFLKFKNIAFVLIPVAVAILATSCKTEYENLLAPYNDIERFTIAGYGDIDSIDAVIQDGEIVVYWSSEAERPEKIIPNIGISNGASIQPATGVEVDFSEGTRYTVTAPDGSTKVYQLKPVFNLPIPSIFSAPALRSWSAAGAFEVNGQYFLATGDPKDIKLYLRRESDGFEFDVPFDTVGVTPTKIDAYLPQFTAELDTGRHRLYVKVGDFESSHADMFLMQPYVSEMISSVDFDHVGNVSFGDVLEFKLTIKEEWKVGYARYYAMNQISRASLSLQEIVPGQVINARSREIDLSMLSISDDGEVKIKMDEKFLSAYQHHRIYSYSISYNGNVPEGNVSFTSQGYSFPDETANSVLENILEENQYLTFNFSHEGKAIKLDETMTIEYSFLSEEYRSQFEGLVSGIRLGLKDPLTGAYSHYEVQGGTANILKDGNKIRFRIPRDATEILNKELIMIGFDTRSGATSRAYIDPRKSLENTSITGVSDTENEDFFQVGTASLSLLQSGQQVRLGETLRVNYSFSNEKTRIHYGNSLSRVLILFQPAAGGMTQLEVTDYADHGDHFTFQLPTSRSDLKGATFYLMQTLFSPSGLNPLSGQAMFIGTNTTVANQ